MTYKERFGNAIEYGKYEASKRLESYRVNGEKYDMRGCFIDLLTCPEWQMSKGAKEQKQRTLKNIERLKSIVKGDVVDPLYTLYFNKLQNEEFHNC